LALKHFLSVTCKLNKQLKSETTTSWLVQYLVFMGIFVFCGFGTPIAYARDGKYFLGEFYESNYT